MSDRESHGNRVVRLLALRRVTVNPPRGDVVWSLPYPEPADLAALYLRCDGLSFDDGFRLLGRGEIADVTRWLVLEKALGWAEDIVVVGERRDVVVALDFDVREVRAGGGVLEATSDDLEGFERKASSVLGYLLTRVGEGGDQAPPPEIAARLAAARGDAANLERELERPMYPGSERLFASLALELGALWAASGDEVCALRAFARSADARERVVGVAARGAERARRGGHRTKLRGSRGASAIAPAREDRVAGRAQ